MKSNLSALLSNLKKADGGVSMSINELKEAQFGIPFKHFSQQYLFASTGLRYGSFTLLASSPKSCKSPFAFDLCHLCCENDGMSVLFEMESKISNSLISSMFDDHPEWCDSDGAMQIVRGKTLEGAEQYLIKVLLKNFKAMGIYDTPLLIDMDSISGSADEDILEKIEKEGSISKTISSKAHVLKHLTETWSQLIGNLPVIFVGIVQRKVAIETGGMPGMAPKYTYGGGMSMLFKAGTLLSLNCVGNQDAGKVIRIRTEMSGFSDRREIDVRFVWNQFGKLDTDSQGHRWLWAEATARCLAQPKIVGDLRDIINVKLNDNNTVTCKQFGLDKVTPEEFETALFAEENKDVLNNLYRYMKIDKIRPPEEYPAYVAGLDTKADQAKEAEKEAKAAERAAKEAELKAKEDAKQAKKEAKAKKQAAQDSLKSLQQLAKFGSNSQEGGEV